MYCPECGASVKEGAKFCELCGRRMPQPHTVQPQTSTYQDNQVWDRVAPGYSRLIDSDAVRAALKRQKRRRDRHGDTHPAAADRISDLRRGVRFHGNGADGLYRTGRLHDHCVDLADYRTEA